MPAYVAYGEGPRPATVMTIHNIAYQGVPVGTIKKHATGKGNAGKGEVIAAMRLLGHPVTDDNEADALALLHWAIDTQEV